MKIVLLSCWVAGLLAMPNWWRETNSRAASVRGERAYANKQYAEAARWFERAQALAPSSRGAFNLGTAQIAAGQRETGSATLNDAMKDAALRPEALFNRGNSALASKAFDHAIADYTETLKLRSNHAGAKRNLEIALNQREAARRAASGGKRDQPGAKQQRQETTPAPGAQQPPRGQPDLETLLRSVQQQEQEELRRMKGKAAAEGRVGW